MSSLPDLVVGIATGNAPLVEMAPGLTPAIAEAATVAAVTACASLSNTALHRDVQSSSTDAKSFSFGWYACIPFVAIALIGSIALDGPAIRRQMELDRRPRRASYLRLHSGAQRLTDYLQVEKMHHVQDSETSHQEGA